MPGIRHHGRGTLVIERSIGGKKVRRASGTNDPATFNAIIRTLEGLALAGRADLVEAVAGGKISPLSLFEQCKAGQAPPSVAVARNEEAERSDRGLLLLLDIIPQFLAIKSQSKSALYYRDLRRDLRILVEAGEARTPSRNRLRDVPRILEDLRDKHETAGKLTAFHSLRSSALALVCWKSAPGTPLYEQVIAVARFSSDEIAKHAREHRPMSPYEAIALRNGLDIVAAQHVRPGEDPLPLGLMFWTLATTGMRPSEYWGNNWHEHREYVEINGTKTAASRRVVPLVDPGLVRQALSYRRFLPRFREIVEWVKPTPYYWTLYDARRAYAMWLENAPIPRTRRLYYMGHKLTHVNDKYAKHKVEPYLWEDGETLGRYIIEAGREKGRTLEDPITQTRTRTPLNLNFVEIP